MCERTSMVSAQHAPPGEVGTMRGHDPGPPLLDACSPREQAGSLEKINGPTCICLLNRRLFSGSKCHQEQKREKLGKRRINTQAEFLET